MNKHFIEKIKADFSQFNFAEDSDFRWNFQTNTVYYSQSQNFEIELLHEIGHALNLHKNFNLDIELLQMEVEAWETAKSIAEKYNMKIPEDTIQDHLDTYRDWLHKRSLCPNCRINCFQYKDLSYKCPACGTKWVSNDSRFKNLRRIKK